MTLESMVTHSDDGGMLPVLTSASFSRVFMFGEQHTTLTYLSTLTSNGVEWAEIPGVGYFPCILTYGDIKYDLEVYQDGGAWFIWLCIQGLYKRNDVESMFDCLHYSHSADSTYT